MNQHQPALFRDRPCLSRSTLRSCGVAFALMLGLLATTACQHRVTVDPVDVKVQPIDVTVNINLKIDRELDQFFAFEDELDPQPAPGGAP